MVNVTPVKYRIAITIRVDDEFVDAVKELRRGAVDDPPSKSEVIRSAVLAMRDRRRKWSKSNGR